MEPELPSETLSRFSEFIARAMGLHFPPARWPDLQRALTAAASDLGFDDPAACGRQLMAQPLQKKQIDVLANHLTVGETYFFREPKTFEVLADVILPELIRQRQNHERRIRIWSAACCTGEEPYSIAMQLRQTLPDLDRWNVTILATDINARFLRKAEKGVFGPWSFRDTPAWIKQRYFRATSSGQFEILPEIRRLVRFANLNLVEDGYPSLANDTNAMDVIFCRNVLMYFTTAQASKVVAKLHRAQMDGGWLLVSASELSQVAFPQYATVNFPHAIMYRKQTGDSLRLNPNDLERIGSPFAIRAVRQSGESQADVAAAVKSPQTSLQAGSAPLPVAEWYQEGRYTHVAETLQQAPPNQEPDAASIGLLARSLANQGQLAEALACCDRWIARDKLQASAHYLRAVILSEQGAIEQALVSLRATVYLSPGFVLAHFALGNIARERGHGAEGDRHLNVALRLSGRYPEDQILPESDGITAGRFAQMVHSLLHAEATP